MPITREQYYKIPEENEEQYNARIAGLRGETSPVSSAITPSGAEVDVITGKLLTPGPQINFPSVPTPKINQAMQPQKTMITPSGAVIDTATGAIITPAPAPATDTWSELEKLLGTSVFQEPVRGETTAAKTKAMEEVGYAVKSKEAQDLQAQLESLQAKQQSLALEAQAIPLQMQEQAAGRGITTGGLAPLTAGELRKKAIEMIPVSTQILTTSAQLNAAQGRLNTAINQINTAIEDEKDYQNRLYDYRKETRSRIYDLLDKEEKKRINEQQRKDDRLQEELDREYQFKKTLSDVYMKAGDFKTASDLINAKTQEERDIIIDNSPLPIDKTEQLKLQSLALDIKIKEENLKILREKLPVGVATVAGTVDTQRASAEIDVLNDKINLIDNLLVHPGLNSRVGPNAIARGLFAVMDRFGAGQSFAGGIQQLTSAATLDTLISVKARGATFGALSNQELGLLIQSATKIGAWEMRDKLGMGKGVWNIDEKSFKDELRDIRRLTEKAKSGFEQNIINSDEDNLLNSLFEQSISITPSNFYK